MTKRRRFWTVGLLALPFLLWGGFATVGLQRGQHFYHGLPSGHWARAVRKHLRHENDSLSAGPLWLRELLGLGGTPAVLKPDPAAVSVLGDLLREQDDEIRSASFETLAAIGPPAVPVLVEAVIVHDDPEIRQRAVKALWFIRPPTKDVMPAVRLLADRDDWQLVMKILGLWLESPEAPSLLAAALHHADVRTRKTALGAVGRAIRVGEAGVARLVSVLRETADCDKDPTCRLRAALLLEYIDTERAPSKSLEASEALLAIIRAAYDPDSDVRGRAFGVVLESYIRQMPDAREVFLQAAHDYDPVIRYEAFIVLVGLRRHWPDEKIEEYLELLTDPDSAVREEAQRHLPDDRKTLATFSRALRQRGRSSPDPAFRRYAAAVVSALGPLLVEDIPPLLKDLHDPDPIVRRRAAESVVTIPGWEAQAATALLATALRDDAFAVRMAAWQAVREATLPASPEVLGLLQAALRHKEPGSRVTAARMLARLGAAARPAVPWLVKALRDPDEGVCREVAEALQKIDR